MDATGSLWGTGALSGKAGGVFFSTATQGGGQETIGLTTVTFFAHHGMVFVPLGYADPKVFSHDEVHGASPYGSGTFAGPDGSRMPSALEKDVAETHGKHFATIAAKLTSA
jgi:NAD(P)H dehydrogenase (quinone)